MGRIVHIECPECRAPIGLSQNDRIVTCEHCREVSVVEGHRYIPEYCLKPVVDKQDARRVLQKILRCRDVPSGMLKESRLVSIELHFVPYNEIRAKRMGRIVTTTANRPLTEMEQLGGSNRDTRIVLSDVIRIEPAVELDDWGLELAEIDPLSEEAKERIEPLDRARQAKTARIHEPTVDPEKALGRMKSSKMAATVRDQTEFMEKRVQRLFYPLWRIKYKYQGVIFSASVDGMTGKVMAARAPENDRNRAIWLIGVGMFVAFILGKLGRAILALVNNPEELIVWVSSGTHLMAFISITGFLLIVIAIAVGWEQFRYPGVLVWRGEQYESEKINRPQNNQIMSWLFDITEKIDKLFRGGRRMSP